jgi:hypothetical protein
MAMAKLSKVSVSLPFGIGALEWQPDEVEARAAWMLYIELVTRIAIQPIDPQRSSAREALNSLYKLFDLTRETLKEAGPNVGISPNSVGGIAIAVLNDGLRPFLSNWHINYSAWAARANPGGATAPNEADWPDRDDFYRGLDSLQAALRKYNDALLQIASTAKRGR